jgi:predicted metalloprotease with PDZ domain
VLGVPDFLEVLGRTISAVLRTPGRHVQSIAESSFDAWIKFYRQDENTPNAVVSYYAKGALVALALDLLLRERGRALDDVVRALWERYGDGRGVPEDGVEALAIEIGGPDLATFFARCVHGTEDPPLERLLQSVGVDLHRRPAEGARDRGGTAGKATARERTWLGAKIASGTEPRLQIVFRGGPAERAGLAANDVLVAVDGLRASAEHLEKLCETRTAGERLAVHAFRRDELIEATIVVEPAPLDTCWLALAASAPPEAVARRESWLQGAAPPATAERRGSGCRGR